MSRITGGCQCGAVRFACEGLGRASICHCRMCQKALGNAFAPLVATRNLVWTRGAPKLFASSDRVQRGFCACCGTPLTYEFRQAGVEVTIAALDDPTLAPPTVQHARGRRIAWTDGLAVLPETSEADRKRWAENYGGLVSHQHPDHDTASWPPRA